MPGHEGKAESCTRASSGGGLGQKIFAERVVEQQSRLPKQGAMASSLLIFEKRWDNAQIYGLILSVEPGV